MAANPLALDPGPIEDGELAAWLDGHGPGADGLIEGLNHCQERHGYLRDAQLRQIARRLRLPLSRVWGTASFYHLFRFSSPPRHSCLICTGTACYVKGADRLLKKLQQNQAQVLLQRSGSELGSVRCIGTCGGAPLAVIDGIVCNHQSGETLLARLAALQP